VRALRVLLGLAAAFSGGACSTSPAVTLQSVGQSPAGSLSPGLASVPVGIVLGFRVTTSSSAVVTAAVDDPSVAAVAPTTQASEFVIIGLATGQTTLHVFVNNGEVTELPVEVTASAP
jgi:Pilus formation protein N terminal region